MDETERFFAALGSRAGTPALGAEEADAILELARVVAHEVQRRFAPLASYVAGVAAAAIPDSAERVSAIRRLTATVRELAPEQPDPRDDEGED